jgi:hypothetical protein
MAHQHIKVISAILPFNTSFGYRWASPTIGRHTMGLYSILGPTMEYQLINYTCGRSASHVRAVALYTVLWTVVAKYKKWPFSAPRRTKTP